MFANQVLVSSRSSTPSTAVFPSLPSYQHKTIPIESSIDLFVIVDDSSHPRFPKSPIFLPDPFPIPELLSPPQINSLRPNIKVMLVTYHFIRRGIVCYHIPEIGCRNKRVPDSNLDSFSVGVELLEILEEKLTFFSRLLEVNYFSLRFLREELFGNLVPKVRGTELIGENEKDCVKHQIRRTDRKYLNQYVYTNRYISLYTTTSRTTFLHLMT